MQSGAGCLEDVALGLRPLLGANDVPGLLRILTLHEERHQGQIVDVLRAWSPGR